MNAEDSVRNLRNLLLNLEGENNTAFYRTFEGDNLREKEMPPTEMSAFLAGEHYDCKENLYITIHPYAVGVDVIISTYER